MTVCNNFAKTQQHLWNISIACLDNNVYVRYPERNVVQPAAIILCLNLPFKQHTERCQEILTAKDNYSQIIYTTCCVFIYLLTVHIMGGFLLLLEY